MRRREHDKRRERGRPVPRHRKTLRARAFKLACEGLTARQVEAALAARIDSSGPESVATLPHGDWRRVRWVRRACEAEAVEVWGDACPFDELAASHEADRLHRRAFHGSPRARREVRREDRAAGKRRAREAVRAEMPGASRAEVRAVFAARRLGKRA